MLQRHLVRDAMIHMKQKKGVSMAQIRKHLESKYAEKLDGVNKRMLTCALKGQVQNGKLQKSGTMYKLSRGPKKGEEELDLPHRRRRHHHHHHHHHRRHHRRRHHPRRRRHHRRRVRHHRRRRSKHHKRRRHHRRRRKSNRRNGRHRHCPRRRRR